ncbi:MAG: DoxX family membrane protein [Gammaproteobacteria bacterium]
MPFLSPELAAYLGSFVELVFPVLLALGLAGRLSAGVLFVFNIVAVISYPALNTAGVEQHQVWGILLLVSFAPWPGETFARLCNRPEVFPGLEGWLASSRIG